MKNKIGGLTKKEFLAIEEFKDSILNKFTNRVSRIILFGSKARGSSTKSSDVDLLVVLTRNGKRIAREIAILTHHPIAKFMVDISPITVDEGFFKEWSPLLEHIQKDGIAIWTRKRAGKNI